MMDCVGIDIRIGRHHPGCSLWGGSQDWAKSNPKSVGCFKSAATVHTAKHG